MAIPAPKNILVAPLDWGFGHTTRCVPLIRHLLQQGHNVLVAGNTTQQAYLKETFYSGIKTIYLEGYNITYSGWNQLAQIGLMRQMPGILKTIEQEHQWLQQTVAAHHIDGIISDNRYGLYHERVPSVILTHQLHIMSGMGAFIDREVQRMHYKYLNRFRETWIVDTESTPSLAGALAHTGSMPEHSKYIGLLSRFAENTHVNHEGKHLLILLSGPEPQRSHLSSMLWEQARQYNGPVVFVAGSDDDTTATGTLPTHISYHKRLGNTALIAALQQAEMVVCRSGYSTIMDLVALGQKAILIPTPGQTEQEYLGKYLHEQGLFYSAQQKGFDLNRAMNAARSFPYNRFDTAGNYDTHIPVVDKWLQAL